MKTLNKQNAIKTINHMASSGHAFLFVVDYLANKNHVIPIEEVDPNRVLYDINGLSNIRDVVPWAGSPHLRKSPTTFEIYNAAFQKVHSELSKGNSYLLNLTFPTQIETDVSLKDIFFASQARYRLWFDDQFIVFSPEIFIKIHEGKISSFPMKGTIDADVENAREQILNDKKEMAEHATIVDLIRNDMSIFANKVSVEEFRYIDEVKTNHKRLLQVSSKITGSLAVGYHEHLGEIIYSLLPAGSVTGAPKAKTLQIIAETESYQRGYYTGVFGYFDGKNFDSAVMIRFIEKQNGQLVYKSGGGIHYLSDPKEEYQELIDKVYVPVY